MSPLPWFCPSLMQLFVLYIFFNVIITLAIKHQWKRYTREVHYTLSAHAFRLQCPGDSGIMFFVWHIISYYGHLQGLEQTNELHYFRWFSIRWQGFSKLTDTHAKYFLPTLCAACLNEERSLKYSMQSWSEVYSANWEEVTSVPPHTHYM